MALPAPSADEVLDVAQRTAKRVAALLEKRGRSLDGGEDPSAKLAQDQPVLASCYSAAAEGKVLLGEQAGQRTARFVSAPAVGDYRYISACRARHFLVDALKEERGSAPEDRIPTLERTLGDTLNAIDSTFPGAESEACGP